MKKTDRFRSYDASDIFQNDVLDAVEAIYQDEEQLTIIATRIFMEKLKIANEDVEREIELYAVAAIGCIQLGLYEMAESIVFGLRDILLKRKSD